MQLPLSLDGCSHAEFLVLDIDKKVRALGKRGSFIAVMEGNAGILTNWISLEKREGGRGRGGEGGGERVALHPFRIVSTYVFCVYISGRTVPKLSVDNSGI